MYEEVQALETILERDPELTVLMNHPKVTKEEKQKVIQEVFGGRASAELTGFLNLLLQ